MRTSTNMWGQFDVPDSSCNPRWSTFNQERCTDSGRRQHAAQLMNIPPNTSWESACQATGATVAGYTFLRPTRCVNKGTSGMWGEFEVDDTTCNPVTECNSSLPAGTFSKPGNTGSVSCEAFCANRDANWGQRGTCVRGLVTSGPHAGTCLACTDVAADQGDTGVTCTCKAPAKGFADLHAHPFANLAFGGQAFYGKAYGPLSTTLPWCDSVHGPGGTRDFFGSIMATLGYGTGGAGHRVGGYPQYDGWPRWNSYTHQSMYEDWLYLTAGPMGAERWRWFAPLPGAPEGLRWRVEPGDQSVSVALVTARGQGIQVRVARRDISLERGRSELELITAYQFAALLRNRTADLDLRER